MFKKLINDSRSEEWNITMYAIILVVLFIIVFTPIILIGINMYPELANTLTEFVIDSKTNKYKAETVNLKLLD